MEAEETAAMSQTAPQTTTAQPDAGPPEMRRRLVAHLIELRRLHLALAEDSRALKRFTAEGQAEVELELTAELLESYLAETNAFLENMRGRSEARLGLLRRSEPTGRSKGGTAPAEEALAHGAFWLAFSRLTATLRRIERRVAG